MMNDRIYQVIYSSHVSQEMNITEDKLIELLIHNGIGKHFHPAL